MKRREAIRRVLGGLIAAPVAAAVKPEPVRAVMGNSVEAEPTLAVTGSPTTTGSTTWTSDLMIHGPGGRPTRVIFDAEGLSNYGPIDASAVPFRDYYAP